MRERIELDFDAKQIMVELVRQKRETRKAEREASQIALHAASQYERFVRICRKALDAPGWWDFDENKMEFHHPAQIQTRIFPPLPCE